ncbi:hypothetical protein ASAC_0083 [Acidilobus saccharovorans 345-15]|uniref:Uncharacterized protein n=1 Tax=Acidilobus saccharovorans (strain DSM 16705 / JCM 18335 / VKM B-2471 / 345-15) TaxID=666510 RepID=D9PZK3_ACIS3|nr:DUF1641 domain-containing protein [Acidilobus saccharovorans]ADL18491.1 hypothetical protein ASAC_0083 [Acidilobus saccharovorans 345-15]
MSQQGPQDKATPQAAQKPAAQSQARPQAAAAPQAAKPAPGAAKPPAPAAQQAAKPQAPQPVILPPPPPVDVGTVAVVELLDAIVKLKRSGLLGMISYLADKAEDSFLSAATDPALMRLMALLASVSYGVSRVPPDDIALAQNSVQDLTSCAVTALGRVDITEERRYGALGMGYRLRDPDVGTSLWILLQIAKGLGRCVRERNKSK